MITGGVIDIAAAPWKAYIGYSKLLNKVKKKLNNLNMEQLENLSEFIDKL